MHSSKREGSRHKPATRLDDFELASQGRVWVRPDAFELPRREAASKAFEVVSTGLRRLAITRLAQVAWLVGAETTAPPAPYDTTSAR